MVDRTPIRAPFRIGCDTIYQRSGWVTHQRPLRGGSVPVLIGVYVGALRQQADAPDLEPGRVASEP
jgi:hypothetical protein